LRDAGVTRITLGIQALDDGLLRLLGREHDAEGARRAYRDASRVFDNICVDLIFGVPGQTVEGWRRTLEEVRSWAPSHVSLYGLILEKGTPFEKIRDRLPEEREREMYEAAMDALSEYHHYEISNWARPGFESRHNRAYWEGRPYLGFGPGAPQRNARRSGGGTSPTCGSTSTATTSSRAARRSRRKQVRIERLLVGLGRMSGSGWPRIPAGMEPFLERAGAGCG
jgi:coproporphyrinogen III oxidase-like Fe-S oxidoreductase